MKTKLVWTTLLVLILFTDDLIACGGCHRKYLSFVEPYWAIYYKGGVFFGLFFLLTIALFNRPSFRSFVSSVLLFLILNGIAFFLATEGMMGAPVFCLGIVFCILWPVISFFTVMKSWPENNIGYKILILAAIMLPLFIFGSMHYANAAKVESEKYIQDHLPEMLQRDYGIIVNQYARKQLLLIRDTQKIAAYEPVLATLLESEHKFEREYAKEVLDRWEGTSTELNARPDR